MNKISTLYASFLFFCLLLMVVPLTAVNAASLYLDPAYQELSKGDSVIVSVRLETDKTTGECVNAVDAVLRYSDNIEPVDVSIGDSIFSLWVEQPTINREEKTVTFAGGIPNGYCGRVAGDPRLSNVLARIVFRSPSFSIGSTADTSPTASISFAEETTAYLNDGSGTKAPLRTIGTTINLARQAGGGGIENPWRDEVTNDKLPPEEFSIILLQDQLTFAGKHYIVFNTTDKQTGIDAYYVMEEPISELRTFQWGRADAPWIQARSPYVLKDQSLRSVIRVRAVDKAGNEYLATLIPDESQRNNTSTILLITLVIFVVLVFLGGLSVVGYRMWKLRSQKRQREVDNREPEDTDYENFNQEVENHEDNDNHNNEYEDNR